MEFCLSKGKTVGPYLARAESYALAIQDKQMFLDLCNKGLAIDPYADPKNKLVNLIYQDRIRYLISKIDVIFW